MAFSSKQKIPQLRVPPVPEDVQIWQSWMRRTPAPGECHPLTRAHVGRRGPATAAEMRSDLCTPDLSKHDYGWGVNARLMPGRGPTPEQFHATALETSLLEYYNYAVSNGPLQNWSRAFAEEAAELGVHPSRHPDCPYYCRYAGFGFFRGNRRANWKNPRLNILTQRDDIVAYWGADMTTASGVPLIVKYEVAGANFIANTPDTLSFRIVETIAAPGHPDLDGPTVIPHFLDLAQWASTIIEPPTDRPYGIPATLEEAEAGGWAQAHEQSLITWGDERSDRVPELGVRQTALVPDGWIPPDPTVFLGKGKAGSVLTEQSTIRDVAIAQILATDYAAAGWPDPEFKRAAELWYVDNRPGYAAGLIEYNTDLSGQVLAELEGRDPEPDYVAAQLELQATLPAPTWTPGTSDVLPIDVELLAAIDRYLERSALTDAEIDLEIEEKRGGGTGRGGITFGEKEVTDVGWFDSALEALPGLVGAAVQLKQVFDPATMQYYPPPLYPQQPLVGAPPVVQLPAVQMGGPAALPIGYMQALATDPAQPGLFDFGGLADRALGGMYDPAFTNSPPGSLFAMTPSGKPRTKSLVKATDWNGDDRYWVGGVKLSARWIKDKVLRDQRKKPCRRPR